MISERRRGRGIRGNEEPNGRSWVRRFCQVGPSGLGVAVGPTWWSRLLKRNRYGYGDIVLSYHRIIWTYTEPNIVSRDKN